MRLTTRTNLAVRVLMSCAANDGRTLRTQDVADRCNASVNHLFQVVNLLQEHGFIQTLRGRSGGIRLAGDMERISIGRVFRLFESGLPFTECFDAESNSCPLVADCRLRGFIARAVEAFYHELDMVTLADLMRGNCGLQAFLDMGGALHAACPAQRLN